MNYSDVLAIIKHALTGRPSGQKVIVQDHELAEVAILDYVEQIAGLVSATIVREAHVASVAGVNCNVIWSGEFDDTDYTYTINAFDTSGNPVAIKLISKAASKLVVKTLVNSSITAIATPYSGINA